MEMNQITVSDADLRKGAEDKVKRQICERGIISKYE